jgi:hypothetical protein
MAVQETWRFIAVAGALGMLCHSGVRCGLLCFASQALLRTALRQCTPCSAGHRHAVPAYASPPTTLSKLCPSLPPLPVQFCSAS